MTRHFACLSLLLALAAAQVSAEDRPDERMVRCGGAFDLCGLVDLDTGGEITDMAFERILGFAEGLSAVRIEGRFGYINKSGDVVIPPSFDLAGPFAFGLAEVLVGTKTGIIDRDGNWVVTPRFGRAVPISPEILVAFEGDWRQQHYDGMERLDRHIYMLNHLPVHGLYHVSDGWVTDRSYFVKSFGPVDLGLIWATTDSENHGPWGLLEFDGTWKVEPQYSYVGALSDGLAIVRARELSQNGPTKNLSGAVNPSGRLVIPLRDGWIGDFSNGFASVGQNGTEIVGVIDKAGNLVGGRFFDEMQSAHPAAEGLLRRVRVGADWFDLWSDGSLTPYVPEPPKDVAAPAERPKAPKLARLECRGGMWRAREGELWGMKDTNGEWVIPPEYQAIDCFRQGVVWVPIPEEKQWCPLGPNGKRKDLPACRKFYAPTMHSHRGPQELDPDPFTSLVLWNRVYLDYLEDPTNPPPLICGDGVMASTDCLPIPFIQ
jgi:hypothetical protein